MEENTPQKEAELSDTSSILSDVDSEQFADLDLDCNFLPSSDRHPVTTRTPTPAQTGSHDVDWSQYTSRMSYRLSDPVSNHEISLGTLDYERSMSEANDTIVVDVGTPTPRISQSRCRSSPVKKSLPDKKSTPTKKSMPRSNKGKQKAKVVQGDTETEDEMQVSPTKKIGPSARKRKRVIDTDEEYGGNNMESMDNDVGEKEKIGRSSATKGGIKARAPVMGKFNVSGIPCATERASSSREMKEPAEKAEEQDPWEAEPFQKEYEAAIAERIWEEQLSKITERPPPDRWYAGVPEANSQWVVCVRPQKPVWYHPDWDAERRKQADKDTAELVRLGEDTLAEDMASRRYEVKKTGRSLVTRHTVTWYQCHSFSTGKRWVFNISLDGYDEY